MESQVKRRILVVEDEVMISMLLEDMLVELGYEVVGPAAKLEDGLALASTAAFDLAVLDVNLNGQRSSPIAQVLSARGIPFVLATGYGADGLEDGVEATDILKKPFTPDDLASVIGRVIEQG
jgi:CheY-like chemotaxis protein